MSTYQIAYIVLLVLSFVLSIYNYSSFKKSKALEVFPYLLGFSVITELLVNILKYIYDYKIIDYLFIYHIYIPIEYSILAYYFYLNAPDRFKRYIILSIPAFLSLSIYLSLIYYSPKLYPGLNINIEGILLLCLSLITLLFIKPVYEVPISSLPVFWICLGTIIYHTGTFFFNGICNMLLESNALIMTNLHRLFVKLPNYFMYICFSISFACSARMKKYI